MLSPPPEMKILSVPAKSTAWKVSKYGVISGSYFPAVGLNTERYSDNFHAVKLLKNGNWTFPNVCYFTWKLEFVSNILWIIACTKFQLKLTIFLANFAQQGCFQSKTKRENITIELCIFVFSLATKFQLKLTNFIY